jgi:predicted DCC family thiol-disulfide oxidoreductase YuxK
MQPLTLNAEPHNIIFFDGVCNLCNYWVNFTIRRDPAKTFWFAPLQGETAKRYFDDPAKQVDSIVLLEEGKMYFRSTAALRITRNLRRGWPLLYGFIIVPRFIRDAVYKWIARNRYKWFGKKEECMIPGPSVQDRFLP